MFPFVNMSVYHDVYLRSSRLTCHNVYGPRGGSDILAKIPLQQGIGYIVDDKTPEGVFYDFGTHSLRMLDFRLTDSDDSVVDLKGNQLTFQVAIG